MSMENVASLAVLVLVAGVGAQWIAWRTRFPAIVLLAAVGLVLGPVTGVIAGGKELAEATEPMVTLCVAIILFEGGLNLQRAELRVAATGVKRLVYVGGPLAWIIGSATAHFVGGLSWPVSLVFGAILVVTGPTVIIPLLRQAGLNRRTASYLKWEGIINDPIGVLLAVLVFQFFAATEQSEGWSQVLGSLAAAVASAVFLGGMAGWLIAKAFLKGAVPEFLKSPVLLTLVLVMYLTCNMVSDEAGLLAVTIMGIVVGNMNLPGLQDMKRFKEYITVILVSVVFVLLTAGMDPETISLVDPRGLALIAAVLFFVRPVSVMLATTGANMDIRDRILLAWIAPRGIVAAATAGVIGAAMTHRGFAGAEALVPLVFGVIFATVLMHGLSISWLSNRLGLSSQTRDSVLIVGASAWSVELAATLKQLGVKVLLADRTWHKLKSARLAGIPIFYGEILSDFADESVELAHLRTVLAATDNTAYNALVCTAMAPEIGRDRVFQLAMETQDEDDPRKVGMGHRGKVAFSEDAGYANLWRHLLEDWVFTKTRVTDEYTYSDLLGELDALAIPIMLLRHDGTARFISPQQEVEPEEGDRLVTFGPPRDEVPDVGPRPLAGPVDGSV
jgi:NhaP-type Na+/H+ or K+/H+ antiporter